MAASLVIETDGTVYDIELPSTGSAAVKRQHIGCRLIDVVALTDRVDMWIDEEGYGIAPVNHAATALARHYGLVWQNYHGNVITVRRRQRDRREHQPSMATRSARSSHRLLDIAA